MVIGRIVGVEVQLLAVIGGQPKVVDVEALALAAGAVRQERVARRVAGAEQQAGHFADGSRVRAAHMEFVIVLERGAGADEHAVDIIFDDVVVGASTGRKITV